MDVWNDNKPVMEKLGLLLFEAQSLEAVLVNFFAASVNIYEMDWLPALQELFDERNANQILKKLEYLFLQLDLPPYLMPKLHQALIDRNWLLHNFYFELGRPVYDDREANNAMAVLESKGAALSDLVMDLNEILIDRQLEADLANEVLNNRVNGSIQAYLGLRETL